MSCGRNGHSEVAPVDISSSAVVTNRFNDHLMAVMELAPLSRIASKLEVLWDS